MIATSDRPAIRCAIYTRKSTDEGLDSGFSSLDAQRESAEAFIASQRAEGWVCLPHRYDDGGYTGGNTERPALARLMADIDAGLIDCVVVYKVDRLSRSLLDFSRLMAAFDAAGVSFVSVTQQFNTTQSMGRLTLNILLSFAQFERELISERTRDKIAAARRSGRWAGRAVLGYDIDPATRALVINEAEAAEVRGMFEAAMAGRSLREIAGDLNDRGVLPKGHDPAGGSTRPWTKNAVRRVLAQRLYCGQVPYRDEVHPGRHTAIVDEGVFEEVQSLLRRRAEAGAVTLRNRHHALLKGLLTCGCCGAAMGHTFTSAGGRLYRYYACHTAKSRGVDACATRPLPAAELEAFVVDQIARLGADPELAARVGDFLHEGETPGPERLAEALRRFRPVWDHLTARERVELVHLAVSGVEYNPAEGMVTIGFHPRGVAALAGNAEAPR